MAFSMHSHSGQFCPGHAKDNLEEIVQTAISRGMQTFALTEHMPRNSEADLYPEELAAGNKSMINPTYSNHHAYVAEALRLRSKYSSQINILIGFEGEWIRPSYGPFIGTFASDPAIDYFIGSVHHVHGIPIDYDSSFYQKAIEASGGREDSLWNDYYDAQYEMLQALKPRVVGHFDLIRLFSPDRKNVQLNTITKIWEKALRNLRLVVEQDGLLEINSAGLRKGLDEPYPGQAVVQEYLKMGGKLTLSDDSHGIAQVGTNYGRAIGYLEGLGVKSLWTLERGEDEVKVKKVSLEDVKASFKE